MVSDLERGEKSGPRGERLKSTRGIFPGRNFVLFALLPCAATLVLLVEPSLWQPAVALDLALAAAALVDLFTLPKWNRFHAERAIANVCSLGERHKVRLLVENRARRACEIDVRDDLPVEFSADPEEFAIHIPARRRARLAYTLTPNRRGSYRLRYVYVRAQSRWGMWQRLYRLPADSTVRVYPDLKQISRYAAFARLNRLSLLGVRRSRRAGGDNEFERLRDYTPDDNYRHIDWRTTGRRRRLTVKDFQTNHNQRVVFLIDAGRMMVNESAGHSLLDHALDAMLMLAHVAVTRGDSVGLLTFSDRVHHWIAPKTGGRRQVNQLVHAVHDLFPELVESRYDAAFLHLSRHCRKRALVILITNVFDDVNARQVRDYLTNLVGRHLPLAVLLRDHEPFDALARAADPPPGISAETAMYRGAAAADILSWRGRSW